MLRLGLTGGIGSGKSYIAAIFEHLGVPVYNADTEVKKLYDENSELLAALRVAFGAGIFDAGKLNRKRFAELVFADANELSRLNAIVHPLLKKHFIAWCGKHSAYPYVVIEAAILFESGFNEFVDKVAVTTSPKEVRIQRVVSRDKLTEQEVLARMQHQLAEKELIERADFTIDASGEQALLPQILAIHYHLLEAFRVSNS